MSRTDVPRRSAEEPTLLREARAVVFALLAVSVSVTLHGWAHGRSPSPTGLLAGTGLMLGLGVLLANRPRGLPMTVGALAAGQAVLHVLFTVSAAGGAAHVMPPPHATGAMLAAHAVAGALSAGWLFAGEVAVRRVVRWLARRVPGLARLHRVVPAPAPRLTRARLAERRAPLPVLPWRRPVVRRGPPAASI